MNITKIIREEIEILINEVEYLNPPKNFRDKQNFRDKRDVSPTTKPETIRVYHGFEDFENVEKVLTVGLSGRDNVPRGQRIGGKSFNKTGLFVTANFDLAKQFADSGVIIEFSVEVNSLESVVTCDYDTGYDNLLSPSKSEARFMGDLNPNMIKNVWYSKSSHKERIERNDWVKMSRRDFVEKLKINTKRSVFQIFLPNDDFNVDTILKQYKNNERDPDFITFMTIINNSDEHSLRRMLFFPKQIKQIMLLKKEGYFNKFLKG